MAPVVIFCTTHVQPYVPSRHSRGDSYSPCLFLWSLHRRLWCRVSYTASGRAIGLIRVSTNKQELSPDVQQRTMEEWCTAHGKVLAQIFLEKNVSGDTPLMKRSILQEAMRTLEAGDVLMVSKWDRIARGIKEAYTIQYLVEQAGAKLVSCEGMIASFPSPMPPVAHAECLCPYPLGCQALVLMPSTSDGPHSRRHSTRPHGGPR